MTELDRREQCLTEQLRAIAHHTAGAQLRPSMDELVDRMVRATGPRFAGVAVVYAELIELAVIRAVTRAGVPVSCEVVACVTGFRTEAVAAVVAAYNSNR